jgi:hypothetical protein
MSRVHEPTIEEWLIVEPPTSEEVSQKAVNALHESGLIEVIVRGELDEVQPETPEVSFIIRQVIKDDEATSKGGMVISGKDSWLPHEEQSSYIIRTNKSDPSLPASLRVIRP